MFRMFTIFRDCVGFPFRVNGVRGRDTVLLITYKTLASSILFLALPVLQKPLVDSIVNYNLQRVLVFLFISLLLYISSEMLTYMLSVKMSMMKKVIIEQLMNEALEKAHSAIQEKTRGRSGVDSGRVFNVSSLLSNSVEFSFGLYGNMLNILFAIGACIVIDTRSILILFPAVVLSMLVMPKPSRAQHALTLEVDQNRSLAIEKMNLSLTSYPSLQFFGIGSFLRLRILASFRRYLDSDVSLKMDRFAAALKVGLVFDLLEILVTGGVAVFVLTSQLSVGSFFSITRSCVNVFSGISGLNKQLVSLPVFYSRIRKHRRKAGKRVPTSVSPAGSQRSTQSGISGPTIQLDLPAGTSLPSGARLALAPRSSLSVVGGNGYGKTSLIEKILQMRTKSLAGNCVVNGNISYSPAVPVFPYITGRELLHEVARSGLNIRTQAILDELQLLALSDGVPFQWSDGERKRFSIGLCLIKIADLYVFDEPLSNIATGFHEDLMRLIKKYTSNSVLICTFHNTQFCGEFSHVLTLKASASCERAILSS